MDKMFKGFMALSEGYQPIINNGDNAADSKRPEPPRGGSGVPNLLRSSRNENITGVNTTR